MKADLIQALFTCISKLNFGYYQRIYNQKILAKLMISLNLTARLATIKKNKYIKTLYKSITTLRLFCSHMIILLIN